MMAGEWKYRPSEGDPLSYKAGWILLLIMALGAMLSTAIAQSTAVGIMLAYIGSIIRKRGNLTWTRTPVDLAIPLIVIARLLSIVYSVDASASLIVLRTELPFYLLLFAFPWLLRDARDEIMVLLVRYLVLGALVASCIGIVVYLGGFHHRATSITSGYYTLGMYLTAVLGLVLGIGRRQEYFISDLLWYGILALLLIGILFTFNRIHWLIAAFLVLLISLARDRRALIGLIILGGAAILLVEPLRERITTLFEPTGSLSDRDVLWREAAKIVGDRPLTGFGPRSFPQIFPKVSEQIDPGIASWHNDMLQIYLESGIVALFGYLLLVGTPLVVAFRALWRNNKAVEPLVVGFGLMLFAVALGGMTGIFYTDPIIQPVTFLSIAVILKYGREENPVQ